MRELFKEFHAAWEFATGKDGAAVRVCNDGWEVTWTGEKAAPKPEPPSAFERIVRRNGGEGKVDAPDELVQRHRVATISESYNPESDADAFSVGLRALSGPYGTSECRFFAVSKGQAQMFKVGTEIQVVLRPAPLG